MIYLKDFMDLKGLEKRIHRDCLFLWNFDVFHYDLRGDSLGVWAKWHRGLLNLIDFEGWIHRDCLILWSFDVFFFKIHRNLMFLGHPDVSGMYGFMHIHRKCPM